MEKSVQNKKPQEIAYASGRVNGNAVLRSASALRVTPPARCGSRSNRAEGSLPARQNARHHPSPRISLPLNRPAAVTGREAAGQTLASTS